MKHYWLEKGYSKKHTLVLKPEPKESTLSLNLEVVKGNNISLKTANIKRGQKRNTIWLSNQIQKNKLYPCPTEHKSNQSFGIKSSPSLSFFRIRYWNAANFHHQNLLCSLLLRSPIWAICSFSMQLPLSTLGIGIQTHVFFLLKWIWFTIYLYTSFTGMFQKLLQLSQDTIDTSVWELT